MDERTRRIGVNEAVFREVNDRVEALAVDFGVEDERLELLCECGDPACVERISMAPDDYKRLRSDSTRFAVLPGHGERDVENVVERRDGYDILMKEPGEPTRLARETDARAS